MMTALVVLAVMVALMGKFGGPYKPGAGQTVGF